MESQGVKTHVQKLLSGALAAAVFLTLIGYRATGKTTLARLLAEELGCHWADSDEEIECRTGKTITQIFAEEGEEVFRKLEVSVIAELCQETDLVLAAGGGAPMRSENRQTIRQAGKVVWLTARPETILTRMAADPRHCQLRPSLTGKEPLEEIVQLLRLRTPVYRALADLEIATDGLAPIVIAKHIVKELFGPPGM